MDYTFIGQMAYNGGSQVTSSLNHGNISIAVNNSVDYGGLNWCATCGVCNGYIIIVDSYFMGKTDIESSQAICYCTGSLDNGVLLSNINKLASTKFEGPFATLEDGINWIETNGLFITNQNYPPIITSGNTLHLDGGLPASYPMVGTSWYDLTGNENNGQLNNGVSYDSSFKGYLNFNGSNQYVSFSGVTDIPVGNSNYTIGVWFSANTLGDKGLVGWGNYETTNEVNAFRLTSDGLVNYWWANDLDVVTTITPGIWYYAVATFDGTTRSIYVNGSLVGSDTPTGHNVTTSSNLTVGVTNNTGYFDGSIGDVQIFDRAITPTEILQNYNSFVTRYDGSNTEICLTPFYCGVTPTPTPTPTMVPSVSIERVGGACNPNQIESQYLITGQIGDEIVLKSTFSGQIQKVGSTGQAAAATSIGGVSALSTCYNDTSLHFFSIAPTYTFTMTATTETVTGSAVTWNSFETLTTLTVEIVSVNGIPSGQSISGCRGDSTGGPCV